MVYTDELQFSEPPAWALVRQLLPFDAVIAEVEKELRPNWLCSDLFELSQVVNRFNDQAPVPKADGPARRSRLALCRLSADSLKLGLGLLGIPGLERMGGWGAWGLGWDLASEPAASNPLACPCSMSLGSILWPHDPSQPLHGRRPCPATSCGPAPGGAAWGVCLGRHRRQN